MEEFLLHDQFCENNAETFEAPVAQDLDARSVQEFCEFYFYERNLLYVDLTLL